MPFNEEKYKRRLRFIMMPEHGTLLQSRLLCVPRGGWILTLLFMDIAFNGK